MPELWTLDDFARMQTRDELFARWFELRKQPLDELHIFSKAARRTLDELEILDALRAADCAQIPGEDRDIDSLIKDRRRLQWEIFRSL